jgi:hypothetical protein
MKGSPSLNLNELLWNEVVVVMTHSPEGSLLMITSGLALAARFLCTSPAPCKTKQQCSVTESLALCFSLKLEDPNFEMGNQKPVKL